MTNPLIKPTTETTATMLNFPPPIRLKHQAIYMLPYESFDGPWAGKTDAKYLSIGLAQWREFDPTALLSAKVWRYPDEKWSRMSEEIPLHRLADLCTLLVKTFYQDRPTNVVVIDAKTLENQDETIELRRMNGVPEGIRKEDKRIKERLRKLRDELMAANLD
jgi:Family of unknown function (DUF6530)